MTLRLIVNADDYGRSAEVSRGIRQAHLSGIVTSTTCMMNAPTVAEDIGLALEEAPDLGLGVHLVLTWGRPLLSAAQLPTLTTAGGDFLKLDRFEARAAGVDPAEAQQEWRAQIERFTQVAGRKPTHLDSHHHSSYFTEGLLRAMLELAREYGCAIRLATKQGSGDPMVGLPEETGRLAGQWTARLMAEFAPRAPDAFHASFYDERASKAEILRIIEGLPAGGVHELMCHPGYADAALIASSVYARQREAELAVLTDAEVREAVARRGIRLATFAAL